MTDQATPGRIVPKELLERFPEINPSNFDASDVDALNAWGIEVVLSAAPTPPVMPALSDEGLVEELAEAIYNACPYIEMAEYNSDGSLVTPQYRYSRAEYCDIFDEDTDNRRRAEAVLSSPALQSWVRGLVEEGQAATRPTAELADSLAAMVTDWVSEGTKLGTDWRRGLGIVIMKRLERFASLPPSSPEHAFDEAIERDAKAGRLDAIERQALDNYEAGRTRELPGTKTEGE